MKILKFSVVALATLGACFAVETRFWEQGDRSDFEKGSLHHLRELRRQEDAAIAAQREMM